jgi:plasmid stability protein
LVCSQTLLARTGTRHDPPCRPPLVCSQTQPCFRWSKPEIGLTHARPGSVRLLLHGRGTCPIRQPSQVHLRVIAAPWSIAARAAEHGRSGQAHWRVIVGPGASQPERRNMAGVPGTLAGNRGAGGIAARAANHSRSGEAYLRVIVAPWSIAVRAAKHGRSSWTHWRVIVAPWGLAARAAKRGGSARYIGG